MVRSEKLKVNVQQRLTVVFLAPFSCVSGIRAECEGGAGLIVVVRSSSSHQLRDVDALSIEVEVHHVEDQRLVVILTTAIWRGLL